MSTLLADLTRRADCADVLHALILLADHLDAHGSPIDYAHRRALFTACSHFIDPATWQDLQRRLRSNHSPDAAHAQRWIFHTLTGSPRISRTPTSRPSPAPNASSTSASAGGSCPPKRNCSCAPPHALLGERGIDEPVRWAPRLPARALAPLRLPGPEPDSITAAQLHQAVPTVTSPSPSSRLKTSTAHVIYLLSRYPVD
ncbi:hypothetical protein J7E95_25395 [Streptomyces sp. ISL-14]|nr:hypothetical protein [Streptomyces sp. ISL-14]